MQIEIQTFITVLLGIAKNMNAPTPIEQRLVELCRSACGLLDCDRSSIFLREGNVYRAAHNYGNPPDIAAAFPKFKVGLKDPLVSRAVASRAFVLVNDVRSSELMDQQTAAAARICAIVVAALLDEHGEPLGFMTAEYNERIGTFSETKAMIVEGLAQLASIVLLGDRHARERQRVEDAKRRLEDQLQQARRLEAMGRLAAGIAHDFNNHLSVISGFNQLLAERLVGQPLEKHVAEIGEAVGRATRLTRQLLVFSHKQALDPRMVDLSAALSSYAGTLRSVLGRDVELVLDAAQGVHPVRIDPVQLEQILLNLAVNARDAMPNGGKLRVATSNVAFGEADIAGSDLPAGGYVRLACSDDGIGMDAATLDRIFEPFFTTKKCAMGTGLGLSIVHSIVSQTGGHIRVESAPGRGTTFLLHFPRAEDPAASAV